MLVADHQGKLHAMEFSGAVKNAGHSLTKALDPDAYGDSEHFAGQSPQLRCKHQAICDGGLANAAHQFAQFT